MELLKRLMGWIRPYYRQFLAILVSMVIYSAVSGGVLLFLFYRVIGPLLKGELTALTLPIPEVPGVFGPATYVLYSGPTFSVLVVAGTALLGILLVRALTQFARSYLSERLTFSVERDLRNELAEHLLRWPLPEREKHRRGDLLSRINHDLGDLTGAISTGLRDLVQGPIEILTAFGIALYIAPLFATAFVVVPAAGYLILRAGRRIRSQTFRTQTLYGGMMDHVHEMLTNLPTIKLAGAEGDEHERFVELNDRYTNEQFRRVMVMESVRPVVHLLLFVLMLLLIFVGYYGIEYGYADVPTLMSVIGLLVWTYRPLRRIAKVNERLQSAAAAYYERLRPLLQSDVEAVQDRPGRPDGTHLQLEDITYAYDTDPVLQKTSMELSSDEFVALTGPNGAGKSTLLRVLLGLYEPDEGTVRLGGQSVEAIGPTAYRRCFAYVPQDVRLFGRTLRANLAFGQADVSDQQMRSVLKRVGLSALLDDLPEGLGTNVQEGGERFSGGQLRRLSLARALLSSSRFIVVDEPGRSIDPDSRSTLYEALRSSKAGVLAVTHDADFARQADRVVYLQEGRVTAVGEHSTLLSNDQQYRQFMAHG